MAQAEVGRHYTGSLGERYFAWQRTSGTMGARLNARQFVREIASTDTVVDFGCGGGFLLRELQAAQKIGIEPNETARTYAEEQGVRVFASAADVRDDTADVVISNHALEHTLSPWGELRELWRILRAGGKLCLWVPMEDWRTQRRPDASDINHHLYGWTPLLLHNLLVEAGFQVREVRIVTHAWPPKVGLLSQLPAWAFDTLATTWSIARRRRQLAAIAFKPA